MSDDLEIDSRLGPAPALSIATLADLGLSDAMIARYFAIDLGRLYTLQKRGRLAEASSFRANYREGLSTLRQGN
ncbi:hypothetical protein [Allomesorhizobium alhagi]|uniref:Uncharacterized protein n=1 Tax=Mesorhizobium alhagi CCNWXJ12-2 TaxID=1107882 RepID=H0I1A0_9HYPH|nr:hypothetical protein [Mesorhizobium alhagi]EHK53262.1 hypothetical protein MAXJ12_31187 [Mesorhizobium alhagi CCNWXJ12-2]